MTDEGMRLTPVEPPPVDLVRALRDVGTGATPHAYIGACPDEVEGAAVRDPECAACAVLLRADALLAGCL